MLTIDDLRNPKRKSGFNCVNSAQGGAGDAVRRGTAKWRAASGSRATAEARRDAWRGPTRKTPDEAAQDYCDYVNGLSADQRPQRRLRSAGHKHVKVDAQRDPEVEAALGVLRDARAQRRGVQGYVYAITDGEYIKIGYSVNPAKRVAELQTGNARILSVLGTITGAEADERALHAKYEHLNVLQEWFEIDSAILAEFGVDVNTPAPVAQAA